MLFIDRELKLDLTSFYEMLQNVEIHEELTKKYRNIAKSQLDHHFNLKHQHQQEYKYGFFDISIAAIPGVIEKTSFKTIF